jgi:ligand-binding sensor domain-containing protein
MKNLLLAVIFSFLCMSHIKAQIGWTIYNSTNGGLRDGSYWSIAVDANGKVWSGGWFTGLAYYDGKSWKKYYYSNSKFDDDQIYAIAIDNNNRAWVGTENGVSVFNGGSTFTRYDTATTGLKGKIVYTLVKGPDGKMWMSSKNGSFNYTGISTYDGNTWVNLPGLPSKLSSEEVTDFAFHTDGTIWIAGTGISNSKNGIYKFFVPGTTGLWSSDDVGIDRFGNVWACGFDGLLKYDGSKWTMMTSGIELGIPSNTYFHAMLIDGDYIWMGTSSGLVKFSILNNVVEEIYNPSNCPLEEDCVNDIAKDPFGNFWMATTLGVVKMDLDTLLSISETQVKYSVSCFPNPASEQLNILSNGPVQMDAKISIFDLQGHKVLEQNLYQDNKLTIDVRDWAKGLYIVNIIDGKHVQTFKVRVT